MSDPLDKATAPPPPTLGEGCLSRYDLDRLGTEVGTEFEGAHALWQQLQGHPDAPGAPDEGAPCADEPAI